MMMADDVVGGQMHSLIALSTCLRPKTEVEMFWRVCRSFQDMRTLRYLSAVGPRPFPYLSVSECCSAVI
jgi:hypothetical protein